MRGILRKSIKGFDTPSIPNNGYATFYAYDNNEDWNTLDLEKNPSAIVTPKGPTDNVLETFTFNLPNAVNIKIDAYQLNDQWDLYVAGSDQGTVGYCSIAVEQMGSLTAARLLLCKATLST